MRVTQVGGSAAQIVAQMLQMFTLKKLMACGQMAYGSALLDAITWTHTLHSHRAPQVQSRPPNGPDRTGKLYRMVTQSGPDAQIVLLQPPLDLCWSIR